MFPASPLWFVGALCGVEPTAFAVGVRAEAHNRALLEAELDRDEAVSKFCGMQVREGISRTNDYTDRE